MAKLNPLLSLLSLFLLLLLLLFLPTAASIPESDLNAAIAALRSHGYALFGNAIAASDLRFDLLGDASFTLFAPADAALFALDMATPAAAYVRALRYHVALRRLDLAALLRAPDEVLTLLPGHRLALSRRGVPAGDVVTADGVDVVLPGIFLAESVAVHGLAGILAPRRDEVSVPPSRSGNSNLDDDHLYLSPGPSAGPPDLWSPAEPPAPKLSPLPPEAPDLTPSPRSASPEADPPSDLDGSYPLIEPGWDSDGHTWIPPLMAPIAEEIEPPVANPPQRISRRSPSASPKAAVGLSWSRGARSSAEEGECTVAEMEGAGKHKCSGHFITRHRSGPRPRKQAGDEAA